MKIRMGLLAAVVPLAMLMAGGRAARASVDVGVQTGAVVGVEMPELAARVALVGEVHQMWRPRPALELGIRGTLGLTTIPYGNQDGEPVIGDVSAYDRSYLKEVATFLPAVTFASRFRLGEASRLTAAVGVTFVVSGEMGAHSILPMPTAGLGLDISIMRTASGRMRARLGVDYVVVRGWSPSFIIPTLGLSWDL